jgi:hypothetical protein
MAEFNYFSLTFESTSTEADLGATILAEDNF